MSLQGAARRKTLQDDARILERASLGIHQNTDLIDPATNFDSIPGLADLKETHKVFEDQREKKKILESQCQKKLTNKWWSVWLTQGVLAIVVTVAVVFLLYLISPPMTQEKGTDNLVSQKQSWKKVLVVAVFVFLLVLLLPEFIRVINRMLYQRKSTKLSHVSPTDAEEHSSFV